MSGHYFSEPSVPSAPVEVQLALPDRVLRLRTDRGVFSHGHVDAGTRLLVLRAPAPPARGTFCDLGCGAGPLALVLAHRSPDAQVWAVDVNPRARELTAANAALNDLPNVHVAPPDEVPADIRFDLIWSNPPIRIGKSALHEMLTLWLARLSTTGVAVLVVNKNLGADSLARWLLAAGWAVERRSSSQGFRILVVRRGASDAEDAV